LLFTLILFRPSYADTRQIVTFGILDVEFLPYQYFIDGVHSGPNADIIQEVFKRLNDKYKVNFKTLPVKRAVHELKYEGIDITAMFKTEERDNYAIFTKNPIHWSTYKIAVTKGNEFHYTKIEDLFEKTFGMMRGNTVSREFDQAIKDGSITILRVKTFEDTLKLLEKRRVDAIVGNVTIMDYYSKKLELSNKITYLDHALSPPKPFRFMISKQSKTFNPKLLKEDLDFTLSQMLKDGTTDMIYKKYNLIYNSLHQ